MATSDFEPEGFDTDWRVVLHWADDAAQTSVADVSCFEFYGQALAAWRQVDDQQRRNIGRKLTGWELIDPNGFELLTKDSHLADSNHLGRAEPGLYRWDEERQGFDLMN